MKGSDAALKYLEAAQNTRLKKVEGDIFLPIDIRPNGQPSPPSVYVSVLPASCWQGHGREADRRVFAAFLCDRLPFRRQDAGSTLNTYGGEGRGALLLN